MVKKRSSRPQRTVSDGRFSLGSAAAETDPLLSRAFFGNPDYQTISSYDDPSAFVIGRTGAGKSATFEHLRSEDPDRVILINPENLALPYLTDLDVIKKLSELGVHLEPFFRALWKHIIVVEVLKHRYHIDTPEAKFRVLEEIRRRLSGDPGRRMALDYLNEFGDRFWCETDERVRQIAELFKQRIEAQGGLEASVGADLGLGSASVGARGGGKVETEYTQEAKSELTNRFQRVVNEAQLPRLNQMIVTLNDTVLDSRKDFTYLLIDDLDKDWVDEAHRVRLIRCLFDSVMDMNRVKRT